MSHIIKNISILSDIFVSKNKEKIYLPKLMTQSTKNYFKIKCLEKLVT